MKYFGVLFLFSSEGLNSAESIIISGSEGTPFVRTEATRIEQITTDFTNNTSYASQVSDNNIIKKEYLIGIKKRRL